MKRQGRKKEGILSQIPPNPKTFPEVEVDETNVIRSE